MHTPFSFTSASRQVLYLKPSDLPAWQRARADAQRRGVSLSSIVGELINAAYPPVDQEPTR